MIELPYEAARVLLVDGITEGRGRKAMTIVPPLSLDRGHRGSGGAGAFTPAASGWGCWLGALFLYLAVFGQWESAMITLASIVIAVPIGRGWAGWCWASPPTAGRGSTGCNRRSWT